MIPFIDTHVHLRDEEQSYKETMKHGLEVARDTYVACIMDMPNTHRPVINEERLLERIALAKAANVPEVSIGFYIGATENPEQLKHAVHLTRKYSPERTGSRFFVAGIKAYAGESVGGIAIRTKEGMHLVYYTLAEEGYDKNLLIHAETERLIKRDENGKQIWDPKRPVTHCHARPPEAEVESVKEQIDLYDRTGCKAKIDIAHASCPESIRLINEAQERGLDISSEVTPHHLIYDLTRMNDPDDGILYKVNPPLRPIGFNLEMVELARQGKVGRIGTDHAAHSFEDKTEKYMSGIPGLAGLQILAEFFRSKNFSDNQIADLMFNNAQKRFNVDVEPKKRPLKDRRGDYVFDPFSNLEKQLGQRV